MNAPAMDVHDVLPMFFERFNAALTLWNLQSTVILGLIAFLATASTALRSRFLLWGLTVAYAVFAAINLNVIQQVTTERRSLGGWLAPRLDAVGLHGMDMAVPGQGVILGIHLVGDAGMIAAIWLIPYFGRKVRDLHASRTL